MAATVLSGTGNVTYTNNTGQNVRVVINYLRYAATQLNVNNQTQIPGSITMSWTATTAGTVSVTSSTFVTNYAYSSIGRNLALTNFTSGGNLSNSSNGAYTFLPTGSTPSQHTDFGMPTEIMLAAGQTFTITAQTSGLTTSTIYAYNIVIIPEAG